MMPKVKEVRGSSWMAQAEISIKKLTSIECKPRGAEWIQSDDKSNNYHQVILEENVGIGTEEFQIRRLDR